MHYPAPLFFLLFCLSAIGASAQTKQITGTPIWEGTQIKTQFIGDKLSINRNDGIAIVNLNGETLCSGIKPPTAGFSDYFSIEKGVFFAQEQGAIVLKDLSGKQQGSLRFQKFQPFITDNTLVILADGPMADNVFAYINQHGKELVRFDRKKYMAVTQTGADVSAGDSFIAETMFLSVSDFPPFSEGLTKIENNSSKKVGFVDQQFKLIIPAKFKDASRFSDGLAAVEDEDGNWGYINKRGEQVIPSSYSLRPSDFSSGLAKVTSKTGLKGFINSKNEIIIAPKYILASNFYKGYALAKEDYSSPAQLIDSTGNVLCTFPKDASYIDDSSDGSGGFSESNKGEKPFYISETLQQLVDYGKGIFQNGGYGLVDVKGNVVLDFKYQQLLGYHDGKMFAHFSEFVDGSTRHIYGVIDEQGQWILKIADSEF